MRQPIQQRRRHLRVAGHPRPFGEVQIRCNTNQPFSGWNDVFPDPGMTIIAIDRLVHHSMIFELNVESYRRRKASDKQSVHAGRAV
ncbi:ATP-binding protein [Paraburkholderia sp. MM5477-R1]|uniref:ATP-binding protein n=1 Tax=Paraburkholderia sp. MM5477-R1 TaxID=2991062 RepID=UPI003D1E7FD8